MDQDMNTKKVWIFSACTSRSDYAAWAHSHNRRRIHDYLSPACQPGTGDGNSAKRQPRRPFHIRL